MKKILLLCGLTLITSNSFANSNCNIYYKGNSQITTQIKKDGFNINQNNYNKLCNELKKNGAGLVLTGMTQISPYQSSASISISLYSLNSNQNAMTYQTSDWIGYEQERTTNAANKAIYDLTMSALDELATNNQLLNKLISNLKEITKN